MEDKYLESPAPFRVGDAVLQIFHLPGKFSFLARLTIATTLCIALIYGLFGRPIVAAYIDFFKYAMELEEAGGTPDFLEIFGAMISIFSWFFLAGIASWFIMASAETAFHKNKLNGIDEGMFPLRFGREELRLMLAQLLVSLVIGGIFFAGYAVILVMALIAALLGEQVPAIAVILGIIIFFGFIGLFVVVIMSAIRLAPTAALSVRDGEIKLRRAWDLTKGRFWPMLGSFLIVAIVGGMASQIVMTGGMMSLFPLIDDLSNVDPETFEDGAAAFAAIKTALLKPAVLIPLIIVGVIYVAIQMMVYAAYWGINSYIVDIDTEKRTDVFN